MERVPVLQRKLLPEQERVVLSDPYARLWLAVVTQFGVTIAGLVKMTQKIRKNPRLARVSVPTEYRLAFDKPDMRVEEVYATAFQELGWWLSVGREIANALAALGAAVPVEKMERAVDELYREVVWHK